MIVLWLAVIVGAIVTYSIIGQVAAIKLSPRVAELCVEQESEITHYKWIRLTDDREEWLLKGIGYYEKDSAGNQKKAENWHKTEETKVKYTTEFKEWDYRTRMFYIRAWWIFYLPYLMNYMADTKQIEHYDPERGKIREAILKQRIEELESADNHYRETG